MFQDQPVSVAHKAVQAHQDHKALLELMESVLKAQKVTRAQEANKAVQVLRAPKDQLVQMEHREETDKWAPGAHKAVLVLVDRKA
jgi:hypothetical protein